MKNMSTSGNMVFWWLLVVPRFEKANKKKWEPETKNLPKISWNLWLNNDKHKHHDNWSLKALGLARG